jgi:death on curing protein
MTFGGLPGVKREADIRSALGRPYSGYHRSISAKAAALLQAMAKNHGFSDGNKRTAVLLTVDMIDRSGYKLKPLGREQLNIEIGNMVLRVVNNEMTFEQIKEWFRLRIRK